MHRTLDQGVEQFEIPCPVGFQPIREQDASLFHMQMVFPQRAPVRWLKKETWQEGVIFSMSFAAFDDDFFGVKQIFHPFP